jgi:long-subunit fatty acid transport protein
MTKTKLLSGVAASALLLVHAAPTPTGAQSFEDTGFSISFGDEVIAGATPPYRPGREPNPADLDLRQLELNVQFDTLARTRILNVGTADQRTAYAAGEAVTLQAVSNYPAFIDHAEIVVFDRSRPGRQVLATLPVTPNGTATFNMPADGSGEFGYVLRVYDASGRFDETVPGSIRREDASPLGSAPLNVPDLSADRTARRNIIVRGGTVVLNANNAIPGDTITVMGDEVRVDPNGQVEITRILPVGDNVIEIDAYGRQILRDVHVPQTDWFRTGIIDIAAGVRHGGATDTDDSYLDGRAAFYVNGYNARGWHVTAAADTTYGPLEDLFSRLDDRDPLRVLDTLRSEGLDLYPTYGDDSTYYDSTPTSGNIFLRLETDTTVVQWGDFTATVDGPGLVRNSRDLYGASISYNSLGITEDGEPRFSGTAYAAVPDTLPQRDILRGTGGSLYFLSRSEIVGGSTNLRVEVTDAVTGFVISTEQLVEGRDYVVDSLQGVIILTEPLSSGGEDGSIISGAGDEVIFNLVAQYEYVPTAGTSIDGTSFGGRVESWINDDVRIGATAMSDETGTDRQTVAAVDARVEFGEGSFIEAEVAASEGPGFGRATSTDGGLTLVDEVGVPSDQAMAFELRAGVQFSDMGWNVDGGLTAYAQVREEGFTTLSEDTPFDQELYGVALDVGLSEQLRFGAHIEDFSRDNGERRTEGELRLAYALNDIWTVTGAIAFEDRVTPGEADETGTRTDVAVRLDYEPNDVYNIYGFVQATVDVSGGLPDNNRIGVGGSVRFNDHLRFSGEVSEGDGGLAADARLSWTPTATNEVYVGYSLDPTRHGHHGSFTDSGRIVTGAAYNYTDQLRVFTEYVFDRPTDERILTQVHGLTYTPSNTWAFSAGLEVAEIEDEDSGDFDRFGISAGAVWTPDEDRSGRARLEYRTEDGDGDTRDRETWAVSAGYSHQVHDDWRLLSQLDAIFSDSEEGPLSDAEYLYGSIGFAYRPIANERLNVLSRLIYIQDTSPEDQRNFSGDTDGPQQRSTVFSVGANYDWNERLTVTGNLAYRLSEVAERGTDDFFTDTATLGVLRLDYEIIERWDVIGEGRALYTQETGITESGALLGLYRHINDTVSLGGGVEWGSVSDDATRIDYDSRGAFVNLIARF